MTSYNQKRCPRVSSGSENYESIDSEEEINISPLWNNIDTPLRLQLFEKIPSMF